MSTQDRLWQDFDPEKNCVAVGDQNDVRLYLAQLGLAHDALQRVVEGETEQANAERRALVGTLQRLRATLRLLTLKYFFTRPDDQLRIDTTDSGYFHFGMLLEMAAERGRRDELLAGVAAAEELKRRMAASIVELAQHPRGYQLEYARRLYLEGLGEDEPVQPFSADALLALREHDGRQACFWSFSTFDRSLNRPFVYLLYFDYDGPAEAIAEGTEDHGALIEFARRTAHGRTSLLAFSRQLDDTLPRVSPKIVRRILLGPYWSPRFTENEGELAELLDEHRERSPFALRWETETLISDRETVVEQGWLSRGRLKQIFWVPKDLDSTERGVSSLERFVLLPHWLGQYVAERGLFGDHRHFVIDAREEVHGVH